MDNPFLGLSSSTWIVIILATGWLVSRVILQGRLQSRHAHWLQRRSEHRQAILHGGKRSLVACDWQDFPGLNTKRYRDVDRELQELGFQALGAYEDCSFTEAFPHLRTAQAVWVSSDRSIVALFGIVEERRFGRRLLLRLRGVPMGAESLRLVTTWSGGRTVQTSRSSVAATPRDAREHDTQTSADILVPSDASIPQVLEHHQQAVADFQGRWNPGQPRLTDRLEQLLSVE